MHLELEGSSAVVAFKVPKLPVKIKGLLESVDSYGQGLFRLKIFASIWFWIHKDPGIPCMHVQRMFNEIKLNHEISISNERWKTKKT